MSILFKKFTSALKLAAMVSVALVITLICATSCGTLTGLYSDVSFDSNPQGATIIRDSIIVGKTPLKLQFKNNQSYNLIIRYPNLSDGVYQFDREISTGTIFADILVTGATGLIVDAITGGFYKDHKLHNQDVFYDFQTGNFKFRSNVPTK